ncbi:hypothetical protein PAPYR_4706 [Paratrimastix pyriformis]|uniref:Centrosomal protein of 44 kDa n=1 Tax=Paratrimastix pyriformis TaxID=342808 RepID=A0ABQ8UJJ3_9EUKA|nr:hypothetical protein PAPYR_4706 [Paratrimastix pyriformis]
MEQNSPDLLARIAHLEKTQGEMQQELAHLRGMFSDRIDEVYQMLKSQSHPTPSTNPLASPAFTRPPSTPPVKPPPLPLAQLRAASISSPRPSSPSIASTMSSRPRATTLTPSSLPPSSVAPPLRIDHITVVPTDTGPEVLAKYHEPISQIYHYYSYRSDEASHVGRGLSRGIFHRFVGDCHLLDRLLPTTPALIFHACCPSEVQVTLDTLRARLQAQGGAGMLGLKTAPLLPPDHGDLPHSPELTRRASSSSLTPRSPRPSSPGGNPLILTHNSSMCALTAASPSTPRGTIAQGDLTPRSLARSPAQPPPETVMTDAQFEQALLMIAHQLYGKADDLTPGQCVQLLLLHDIFPHAHRGTVVSGSTDELPGTALEPLRAYRRDLLKIFQVFTSRMDVSVSSQQRGLALAEFMDLVRYYKLFPYLSKYAFRDLFHRCCALGDDKSIPSYTGKPGERDLTFPGFLEALARMGVAIYGAGAYAASNFTPEQQVAKLLSKILLLNPPKQTDIRGNKSRACARGAGTIDVVLPRRNGVGYRPPVNPPPVARLDPEVLAQAYGPRAARALLQKLHESSPTAADSPGADPLAPFYTRPPEPAPKKIPSQMTPFSLKE